MLPSEAGKVSTGSGVPPTLLECVMVQLQELDQQLAETCEAVDHLHHRLLGPSSIDSIPENPSGISKGSSTRSALG